MKKDQKRPSSNFSFDFITNIVAADSCTTGYLVDVTAERVGGGSMAVVMMITGFSYTLTFRICQCSGMISQQLLRIDVCPHT